MSDNLAADAADEVNEDRPAPDVPDAVETTETYRTDDGTVFYDADNPLAWIQTADTVTLEERA